MGFISHSNFVYHFCLYVRRSRTRLPVEDCTRLASAVFEYDPSGVYVVSIFLTGRGLGNVLCAPISTALGYPWALANTTSMAYGLEGFGPSIIFTGTTLTRQLSGCYVLRALLRQIELGFIFYTGLR
ncbi:hypothetical protein C8R41DRAFT_485573 [Lentinula lateritia]|uniref:MFS general substrate transporter n=1 Tax=Lentinula lateritia TaxID=40482 RepID=A0ABQ8VVJ6_9AGAR|nr:hypothetical protein C8R41DRAFT_485573 [Lentinula lateritia]